MEINIESVCDIGSERANNEDAVAVCPDLENQDWESKGTNDYIPLCSLGALAVVADGMGGANAGEVASSLAINSIRNLFGEKNLTEITKSDSNINKFLRENIAKANEAIMNYVSTSPDAIGLGTTIVLAWFVNGKAHIAWCGDSRCYCFNPNSGLKLLTKDHSLVQEMVDNGEIKSEEAFGHPDNNIITRCLGDVDTITEPEIITYDVKDGDIFLLCSDGLCGYCRDSLTEKTLYRHYDDLKKCQTSLLDIALDAGGQDNISIALCALRSKGHNSQKIGFKGKIKRLMARL